MNTYQIKVGRYTRKQVFEKLYEFVINSENMSHEIEKAYSNKYQGFRVDVLQVENIEVITIDQGETKKQEIKEIPKTVIRKSGSEYDHNKFVAEIPSSDIKGWDELVAPIIKIHKEIAKEEEILKDKIKEMFGLKNIEYFNRNSNGVSFTYYNSWFDFKGTTKKEV